MCNALLLHFKGFKEFNDELQKVIKMLMTTVMKIWKRIDSTSFWHGRTTCSQARAAPRASCSSLRTVASLGAAV